MGINLEFGEQLYAGKGSTHFGIFKQPRFYYSRDFSWARGINSDNINITYIVKKCIFLNFLSNVIHVPTNLVDI